VPYRAALTRSFLRELRKLPDDVKSRVLEAINNILANPFSG
jgi:mRNA-degrading endonuclease RelE of RelBE toxin-antitoxin system